MDNTEENSHEAYHYSRCSPLTPLMAVAVTSRTRQNKEQLTQVSRIFVSGEGPAFDRVRDRIGRAKGCFVLTETSTDSDAVLQVGFPDVWDRRCAAVHE